MRGIDHVQIPVRFLVWFCSEFGLVLKCYTTNTTGLESCDGIESFMNDNTGSMTLSDVKSDMGMAHIRPIKGVFLHTSSWSYGVRSTPGLMVSIAHRVLDVCLHIRSW